MDRITEVRNASEASPLKENVRAKRARYRKPKKRSQKRHFRVQKVLENTTLSRKKNTAPSIHFDRFPLRSAEYFPSFESSSRKIKILFDVPPYDGTAEGKMIVCQIPKEKIQQIPVCVSKRQI